MGDTSLSVMVGRPEPQAPPMVQLTLVRQDGVTQQFWLIPDAARDFADEVAGYADEADRLRLT
jgi:hypothetical protein